MHLFLTACATSYDEMGWWGYGVEVTAMGGDVYRVTAQLNDVSTEGMVQDFIFLRAAEIARDNGAAGFVIMDSQSHSQSGGYVSPGRVTTIGTVTTYSPGVYVSSEEPGGSMTIHIVREPQSDNPLFIDAATTIAAISPRVRR
jgi:hypothetical protein